MLKLTDKSVEALITKTAKQRSELTEKRLRNYQVFIEKNVSSELDSSATIVKLRRWHQQVT